jgi:hypothetical protein
MPTSTRKPRPTAADRFNARLEAINETAEGNLIKLVESVTQGEWLAIRRALDLTRAEIGAERTLTLLALGYVKEKREHGAASWDVLLGMTDDDIARLHGFMGDDDLKALEAKEKAESVKEALTPDGQ